MSLFLDKTIDFGASRGQVAAPKTGQPAHDPDRLAGLIVAAATFALGAGSLIIIAVIMLFF